MEVGKLMQFVADGNFDSGIQLRGTSCCLLAEQNDLFGNVNVFTRRGGESEGAMSGLRRPNDSNNKGH